MLDTTEIQHDDPARDARKQQLIDATIHCIYQHGLEKTTISRVTARARLSAGIVNFYFESKDKLLLGVLRSVRDEFHHRIIASSNPSDPADLALLRIIEVHFTPSICSPEKISVWHAFAGAGRTRRDYNDICGELEREIKRLLLTRFTELCNQEGKDHYHAEVLARGLEGLLDSLWQECLYSPKSFDASDATEQCRQYLASLFPETFKETSELKPIVESISEGGGMELSDLLPRWTYDNDEFFQLEIDHLFKKHWMLAGHVNDIRKPGDYITFEGFGERAIILREKSGALRAFHNVCRHRGARLLQDKRGNCPHALSCPFHGWTYDLNGKLIGIPARDTFDSLDADKNSLVPLEAEVWMGFIFVRFHTGGKSMAETMAPVESLIAPYRIDEMEPIAATAFDELRPYNWKIIHDIDNEGYHVPVGHPALQQLYGRTYQDGAIEGIPLSTGQIEDRPGRNWSVRHYQKVLPEFDHLPKEYQRMWQYIGIFPNQVIGLYPESIEFYMTIPVTRDTTRYIGGSYALPHQGRAALAAQYLNRRINNQTEQEDEQFVVSMQEGLRSSAFPEQKLSSREQGVRHFHKLVQAILPVANCLHEPVNGEIGAINRHMFENRSGA